MPGLAADAALVTHLAVLAPADAFRALVHLCPSCAHPFNTLLSSFTLAGDPSAAFARPVSGDSNSRAV
nr:unnamed protein product [Digitaria exilis]